MSELQTFTDAASFKAIVERFKANGWADLPEESKAFICMYIRDGYSIAPMLERGCAQEEAESYLNDPIIKAAISDISEQYSVINTFSVSGWRSKLSRALDIAMGETPTEFVTKEGTVVRVKQVDLSATARLLELAVKYKDIKDEPRQAEFQRFPTLPWEKRQ